MGLPLPVAMGIWVLVGIVLMLVMVVGLRHRRAQGAGVVPRLPQPPVAATAVAEPGAPRTDALGAVRLAPVAATYVSSTRSGDWLARIDTPELGTRARATVSVHDAGVLIDRPGPGPLFIPAAALAGTSRSSGMAGKFVGRDGLDVVTWRTPDGVLLDTGLRLAHRAERAALHDAVASLVPAPAGTTPAGVPSDDTAPGTPGAHRPNQKESS